MSVFSKIGEVIKVTRNAAAEVSGSLESVRVRIIALKDEREKTEWRAVPKAEALARLDGFIEFIGRPLEMKKLNPNDFTATDNNYRLPPVGGIEGELALAVAAPQLRERLAASIDAIYAARGVGVSQEDRGRMLAKLDAEIFDLELVEESLIRSAEKVGIEMLRRGDADPRAVLAHDSSLPS